MYEFQGLSSIHGLVVVIVIIEDKHKNNLIRDFNARN